MDSEEVFETWGRSIAEALERSGRESIEAEVAFWAARAGRYDERNSLARSAPQVVQRVTQLVAPGASVLEIGAGTGEFTLPVARRAGPVTALDLSSHMLGALREKARQAGVENVTLVEADWEETDLAPHDVVLAVNSLYRLREPRQALEKILRCASQRGILVRSVGANPPAPPEARQRFGPDRYPRASDHEFLLDGLAALGVSPTVEILDVRRTYRFDSVEEAASACLPWPHPTAEERDIACHLVRDTMAAEEPAGTVTYQYPGQVAVIWWSSTTRCPPGLASRMVGSC